MMKAKVEILLLPSRILIFLDYNPIKNIDQFFKQN